MKQPREAQRPQRPLQVLDSGSRFDTSTLDARDLVTCRKLSGQVTKDEARCALD